MSTRRARPPMRKPVATSPAWAMPAAVVGLLALLVATFLVIRWYTTPLPPPAPSTDTTQQIITKITTLPSSEFDNIGQGTASNLLKPVSGSPLTGSSGKPEVFYLGGEFCPFCAAERWPLIIALSRFGTFSGLQPTTSASDIEFPNTPTFTFRSAQFTSQYIDFRPVESSDRDRNSLQTPTAAEQKLFDQYDSARTIPFVDLGNRYAFTGAMYSPSVLAGMTWQEVATALQDPSTAQAKAIIGSANLITAAVCKTAGDQPSSVCGGATIQGLEKNLK